jgi:hypothetical protein
MFGGVGFLLNGNLLVGVWKDSIIVRLGPDVGGEALLEPHVSEFNITGRAMKAGCWSNRKASRAMASWPAGSAGR